MRRRELPSHLASAFTSAEARDAGLPRSRLRARDLEHPFHGVRARVPAPAPASPEDALLRRLEHYAVRMTEHEFFSHVSAAIAWGLPLPRRVIDPRTVDVSVVSPRRASRGAGVRGHEVREALVHLRRHPAEVLVTSPACTWAMLGPLLVPRDLVAVADAIVREPRREGERPALATLTELEDAIGKGRRPGIRALRAALPRVRSRVDSPPETHLRLLLVDAGLPEPQTGFLVEDARGRIGHVDLAYPGERVAIEYEGEHHQSDLTQWTRDIHRYERMSRAGWHVIRVTREDLYGRPQRLVVRIRSALLSRA